MALAALAGLSYAAYSLIGGKLIARGHPSGAVMGAMFGAAALLVLPVVLGSGMRWLVTVRGAAVAVHLAVVTTFLAYRLFGYGLRHTAAQVATMLTLAEPAVAAVLGVVVLGERLPAVSWCGLAVLAVGLAFLSFPGARCRGRGECGSAKTRRAGSAGQLPAPACPHASPRPGRSAASARTGGRPESAP